MTNCHQLKYSAADGKVRYSDVADLEHPQTMSEHARVAERLKYVHMLENGFSLKYIEKHFGIDHKLLGYLWARYKSEGTSGLIKKKNVKADYALKVQVVRDIEENHLTMVSLMRIRRWGSDGSSVLLP